MFANRTEEKTSVVYLLGDSHAAQFYFMFEKVTSTSPYQLRFMNDERSFPYSLMRGEVDSISMGYVIQNLLPGDVVAVAYHRGRLNDSRDSHIPLSTEIVMNGKSDGFLNSFADYVDRIYKKGGKLMLIRDTPLMAMVMMWSNRLVPPS